MPKTNLVRNGRALLEQLWTETTELAEKGALLDSIEDPEFIAVIRRCVNSDTKTYRYVLPTQLLAKAIDPALDCRCLQAIRGGSGSFDARTLAHRVVVSFDRDNEKVLGGSPEPYVNNPLRVPEVSPQYRQAQDDKPGWDDLCRVLQAVEDQGDPSITRKTLQQVLKEVHNRLGTVRIAYPVPHRTSLDGTLRLVEAFVATRSGGDRFQAVTAALFLALGRQFHLFDEVRRETTTAADAASGRVADIECINESGEIVFVVEAKDRELTITQLQSKVAGLREHHITEAFFVAAQGIAPADEASIRDVIEREFSSGQNIYAMELRALTPVILALLGEAGRRRFLEYVGDQLNEFSDLTHRQAWATLLRTA